MVSTKVRDRLGRGLEVGGMGNLLRNLEKKIERVEEFDRSCLEEEGGIKRKLEMRLRGLSESKKRKSMLSKR